LRGVCEWAFIQRCINSIIILAALKRFFEVKKLLVEVRFLFRIVYFYTGEKILIRLK